MPYIGNKYYSTAGKYQAALDNTPKEGQTWNGGWYYGNQGYGTSVPAGYVYNNGQWVSPITAQANNLAQQKIGYETQNLGIQNLINQEQLKNQQIQNQIAQTAGGQLNQLIQNPESIVTDPSYQFQYNQGLEAINRTKAAKGMLGSGNRLYDLMNYGQNLAKTSYGDAFNRLGSLLQGTTSSSFSQNQNRDKNQYQTNPIGSVSLSGSY